MGGGVNHQNNPTVNNQIDKRNTAKMVFRFLCPKLISDRLH